MPSLLLELFSEEIPARMQAQAARDLERLAREKLAAAELTFGAIRSFAGPRRLTLVVDDLPAAPADRTEERKGPRANAPEAALAGFLRSTGLARDQLTERDGVFFATLHRPGRPTPQIVAEMVEAIVRGFPWPKSMRWGSGTLRWVRPLKRIVCILDGATVPFEIDGIESSNITEGHRFMGERHEPFLVLSYDDYLMGLATRFVMLDPAERRAGIAAGAEAVCAAKGLEWVRDEGLLDEVVGLAEWPVPILGDMGAGFLDLPAEVIRTSMRVHQRYFAVRDPATGDLAPHFVVVANIAPKDGGAVIAHGNARVLTARLADARFFWDEDRKPGNFDRWAEKLQGVTFHAKLGTIAERVERIAALAREIAPLVGADPKLTEAAARLCKADLASGMVGEFPELQGVMGGYYVRAGGGLPQSASPTAPPRGEHLSTAVASTDPPPLGEGDREALEGASAALSAFSQAERETIADAVRDHYKPLGPSDSVPTAPVTVAVALADKLDTLVGFFAIDERPTGSRDPFALRRAALGVIRLIIQSDRRLALKVTLAETLFGLVYNRGQIFSVLFRHGPGENGVVSGIEEFTSGISASADMMRPICAGLVWETGASRGEITTSPNDLVAGLLAFFADRLKVLLRDEGKRHDLVDAVFALGDDDLVRIVRRVDALSAFLATEDGASLLAGYKRAANILKAEAKKTPGEDHALNWDLATLERPEEQALSAALRTVQGQVDAALEAEDFEAAMRAFSHLRAPVDAFFDHVLVNAPEPAVRLNRLRLLSGVRDTANRIADFSLVASA